VKRDAGLLASNLLWLLGRESVTVLAKGSPFFQRQHAGTGLRSSLRKLYKQPSPA
jgi:hypothetical protein